MTLETLHTALDALAEDVNCFKSRQEEKLQKLEQKISCKMNISSGRPGYDLKTGEEGEISQKAFTAFLRKGDGNVETKALSRGEEPGSYMLPHPVQERITHHLETGSTFRSIARVMNISSGSAEIILDRNLPNVGWVGETEERGETQAPTLAKMTIPVHEIYAKPKATQTLLDDSVVNLEDWLVSRVAEKMVRLENEAFILGDGDKKPKGFLAYETVEKAAWEWGKIEHLKTGVEGGFQEDAGADTLLDLMERLKTQYLAGSMWIMSRSAHTVVRKLMDHTTGHHLWQPSLAEGAPATLLGYPVLVLDEMPALVAKRASKSIAFGNFKEAYQIVDRLNMNVLRDPYSAKPYVEFYVTKRVGGDVINFEAIKVLNFAS